MFNNSIMMGWRIALLGRPSCGTCVSHFKINYLCSFTYPKLPHSNLNSFVRVPDLGRTFLARIFEKLTISLHLVSKNRHIDSKFRPSSPQVSFAEI